MRFRAILAMLPAAACGRIAFDPLDECGPLGELGVPYANSQQGADGVDTPFLLCTERQLAAISERPEDWDRSFRLGADLDLRMPFARIATDDVPFTGAFDGGGHTISHVVLDEPSVSGVAMFGYVDHARFSNLVLASASVHGDANAAVLISYANGLEIDQISVDGTVVGQRGAGGLIGTMGCAPCESIHVSNITVSIDLQSESTNVGGAVAIIEGAAGIPVVIESVSVSGKVRAASTVGGAFGYVRYAELARLISSVEVDATADAGGLVGDTQEVSLRDSSASGAVGCRSSGLCGGLVADSAGSITRCHATGRVECLTQCGGLVAEAYGPIRESYATGDVITSGPGAGGLAAATGSDVSDSYATGAVSGTQNVGGLVGDAFLSPTITRSYSTSRVIGEDRVGGLVGRAGPMPSAVTITDSFATGSVQGTSAVDLVSPLVGTLAPTTMTSGLFYDSTASCLNGAGTCTDVGTGVAGASYFHSSANDPLVRWDFTNVWREVPGAMPELR